MEPLRIWLAASKAFGLGVFEMLQQLDSVCVVGVTAPSAELPIQAGLMAHSTVDASVLRSARTDLIVSAQNLAFIGAEARAAAKYGAIGYHPSLLPRWQGKNAVQATIDARDPIAGGTVYLMDDGWDTGPIIRQQHVHVLPGWNAKDLWRQELFPLGLQLLRDVIVTGAFAWELEPQNQEAATRC